VLKRFIEWYPRYREAFKDPVFEEVYDFIDSPHSLWSMAQASENGKPALSGVVKELESKFAANFDFDNPMNRRMIGSMIKEILHDFGYRRKGQRLVPNSNFFTTASYYEFEADKARRKVTGIFEVHSEEEDKELIEREPHNGSIGGKAHDKAGGASLGGPGWPANLPDNEAEEIIARLSAAISNKRSTVEEVKEASTRLYAIAMAALSTLSAVFTLSSSDSNIKRPGFVSSISPAVHAAVERLRLRGEVELNIEEANLILEELLKEQKDNEELFIEKTGSTYKLSLRSKGD
jgi:hypothetical protein